MHPAAANYDLRMQDCCCRPSVYLDGVLVSYTNPCILSKQVRASITLALLPDAWSSEFIAILQARIHPYFPYFHVDVSADCVLFKPAVGQILGKIWKG